LTTFEHYVVYLLSLKSTKSHPISDIIKKERRFRVALFLLWLCKYRTRNVG